MSNRILVTTSLAWITTALCCGTVLCQEKDFNAYPQNVAEYLKRIYDQKHQALTYRDN